MRPNAAASAGTGFTPEQERTLSKVLWKIVPFLLLCYVFAYLDRVNVGATSLTMNKDLGLSRPSSDGAPGCSSATSWPRAPATSSGIMCYQSTSWPIPSISLTGSAAAGGLALIVSIGNLGGFAGPYLIGEIRQATGSFSWALIAVAGFLMGGAVLIRVVGISMQRRRAAQVAAAHT